MKKSLSSIIILALLIASETTAMAAIVSATTTGNWATAATWGGTVPAATDSCIIPSGITVTLGASATCGAVAVDGILISQGNFTLTLSGGGSTPVTYGAVGGTGTITTGTLASTAGTMTLTSGDWLFSGTFTGSRLAVKMSSTVNDQSVSGALSCRTFTVVKGASTLHIAITPTITTTTLTSGNVDYNGAAQNILRANHPGTLTLNGSGIKTLALATRVTGDVTVNSGTSLAMSTFLLTLNGNLINNGGTISGTTGGVTIGGTTTQSIAGFTTTGTVSMTKSAGTATFTGNVNGNRLTINGTGGTLNLGSGLTHTFTGVVTLTAGTLNGGSSKLNENATSTTAWNGTGTNFIASSGTVKFGGAAQTLATASTFNNLTFSNSGLKTLTGVPTVNGILSMEGTATVSAAPIYGAAAALQYNTSTARNAGTEWITPFVATGGVIIANTGKITLNASKVFDPSAPLIIYSGATLAASTFGLTLGGSFSSAGTFTAGSGTVTLNGASQAIPLITFNNLILSGSGTKSAGGALTVSGTLNNSVTLDMAGSTLSVAGTTTNTGGAIRFSGANGLAINSGTIEYYGSGQTIAAGTYENLSINQSGADATLGGPVIVNGTLSFVSMHNVALGAYNLTLSGSVSGAGDGKCVVTNGSGVVSRTITAGQGFIFPIGTASYCNSVTFSNVAGGTYSASVVNAVVPATENNAATAGLSWTFTGTVPVDLALTWNDAQKGASCDPGFSSAWRYNGTTWVDMGGNTSSLSGKNTTTVIGLTSFSTYTVGVSGALPVELTSFTATMQSATSAILKWNTATEENNLGFEIERREEGSSVWTNIGYVAGSGTSNSPKEYTYQDANLAPGVYVYRLKQIDIDGKFKYAASTQVNAGASKGFELLNNYPNPFNPETNIRFSVPESGFATLKVYNIRGQEVATLFSGIAEAGHYIPATFNGGKLASGVYFSRLEYNGKSIVQRMLMTK